MDFISLVTTDSKVYGQVKKEVFEDLKLTQLFSDNVLSVMCKLPEKADIFLRQNVFRELNEPKIRVMLGELLRKLESVRKIYDAYESSSEPKAKQYIFCALLHGICDFYSAAALLEANDGFLAGFANSFKKEISDEAFQRMKEECDSLYSCFFGAFSLLIESERIVVSRETKEGYITAVRRCAEKMNITLRESDYMPRSLSKELIQTISLLYPELWTDLERFHRAYLSYPDRRVLAYIDQIDFYLSVFSLAERCHLQDIPVCFASITDKQKIRIMSAYDVTLLSKNCKAIIPNDVIFDINDPFFFLSGANGGGKTTYLRACGVNVILSLLGCPVPAVSSELCMLDTVEAHFPRDERFDTDGRFLDEQKRVDDMLCNIGTRSLVLLNETYSTTNEAKAAVMTVSLAKKLYEAKQFGVYVTHQKSVLKENIPLLSCVVDESDGNKRTYRIQRIHNIGSSHAEDILKKYSLSFSDLTERFGDLG